MKVTSLEYSVESSLKTSLKANLKSDRVLLNVFVRVVDIDRDGWMVLEHWIDINLVR